MTADRRYRSRSAGSFELACRRADRAVRRVYREAETQHSGELPAAAAESARTHVTAA